MSIQSIIQGSLVKPNVTTLTGTLQTVATTGQTGAIIAGFSAVNPSGGAITLEIEFHDGTNDYPVFHQSIAANDTLIVSDFALNLPNGYSLKAKGSGLEFRPIVFSTPQNAQSHSLS